MTGKTAYVEIRSQHSRGSGSSMFGGPDTYVSVQIVPDGVARLTTLNCRNAKLRGIELIYCGEGYKDRQATIRSALGSAIVEAHRIANEINDLD